MLVAPRTRECGFFYFSAVDVAEVAGFGAYFVTRYPPHAANTIPKIKIPDTLLQALVLVVLTMAFTIGAPAKIIDIITGTYATVGFGAAPKASNTPSAPIAPSVPAISDHCQPFVGYAQKSIGPPLSLRIIIGAITAVRK